MAFRGQNLWSRRIAPSAVDHYRLHQTGGEMFFTWRNKPIVHLAGSLAAKLKTAT
jgi:hypothetical protein